jgi:predicted PurR-regulated permease PerM
VVVPAHLALLEVEQFRRKLVALDRQELIRACSGLAAKFRRYMLVRTVLSLLTGLAIFVFAIIAGLEPAPAWGILGFALNYIPFIGPFVATRFCLRSSPSLSSTPGRR